MKRVLMVLMIPREEGLAALWKGHLPAQALSVTYGFARYNQHHSAKYCFSDLKPISVLLPLKPWSPCLVRVTKATVGDF